MDKQEDALREFGRRLTQLREEQGLSVAELASRTGLDPLVIRSMEAGERNIHLTTIFRLAVGLGVEPVELLASL
jgi:transcriptional regulator with XRE-family HTH domain